jgi:hypothetical protein
MTSEFFPPLPPGDFDFDRLKQWLKTQNISVNQLITGSLATGQSLRIGPTNSETYFQFEFSDYATLELYNPDYTLPGSFYSLDSVMVIDAPRDVGEQNVQIEMFAHDATGDNASRMQFVADSFSFVPETDSNFQVVLDANGLSGAGLDWKTWTPTLTGITQGNGTIVARYAEVNKTVFAYFDFTFGSSGSAMGSGIVSLPVAASANYTNALNAVGHARFSDANSTDYLGFVRIEPGSTIRPLTYGVSGSLLSENAISSTAPYTWVSGDRLFWFAIYEGA